MKYPIFHVGETCYAYVAASDGEWMECEITGPRTRRALRDLDGQFISYVEAYRVLLDRATMECIFAESDLRKKWQRCDWGMLRGVWQPQRDAR